MPIPPALSLEGRLTAVSTPVIAHTSNLGCDSAFGDTDETPLAPGPWGSATHRCRSL